MWPACGEVVRLPSPPGVVSSEGLKPSTVARGFAFRVTCEACSKPALLLTLPRVHSEEAIHTGQGAFVGRQTSPQVSMVRCQWSAAGTSSASCLLCCAHTKCPQGILCLFAVFSGDIPPGLESLTSG